MLPPSLDQNLGLLQRVEDLAVQQLVAELAIEALQVAVLPRRAFRGSLVLHCGYSLLHATADRDIDLLVQFAPGNKSYERFLALSELLQGHLGRRVELVTTEGLPPFIRPRTWQKSTMSSESRDYLGHILVEAGYIGESAGLLRSRLPAILNAEQGVAPPVPPRVVSVGKER